MSYIAVEPATETMLKAAFQAALTTAGLSATIYGFWIDDAATEDSEEVDFPQINIKAAPSIPEGWRSPVHVVPVSVDIITFQPDDKKRATLVALYAAVRDIINTEDFTAATFSQVPAVTIDDGGDVYAEPPIQLIRLELSVNVCTGAQDFT